MLDLSCFDYFNNESYRKKKGKDFYRSILSFLIGNEDFRRQNKLKE